MNKTILLFALLSFISCVSKAQMTVESLAAQVQELLDEKAIQNVKIQYGNTMDDKDFEAFTHVFADTVTVDLTERGGQLLTLPREAVVGIYKKQLVDRTTQHFLTNMDIELNGDEAKARTNYYSIHLKDGKRMDSTGWSYETYLRTSDGWKISAIKLSPYVSPSN